MNFTLDQLRAFLEVSRSGGVRRAAERLNLTQPAVTARIKSLEEALGAELFDRSDGMRLNQRGDALLRYAEQYVELGNLIARDVAGPDGFSGVFRIGVSETIVQSWLPEWIRVLRERYPNLSVEIDVDISIALRERLLHDQIDLALLMGPVSDFRIENVDLPLFPMSWYRAVGSSCCDPSKGVPVISFARDTRPFRTLRQSLLERYGPDLTLFPSSSLSACYRLVATGLGIGALPDILARPYVENAEIERFDLGWKPDALAFTASFQANGSTNGTALARQAANLALEVAESFDQ